MISTRGNRKEKGNLVGGLQKNNKPELYLEMPEGGGGGTNADMKDSVRG